jgi:bisphosphoglycerate-dependent phosphoglycerate mutase
MKKNKKKCQAQTKKNTSPLALFCIAGSMCFPRDSKYDSRKGGKEEKRRKKKSIDKKLYLGYTGSMKTAISLSDTLFEVAEQTAQYMGVPRSRLFVIAMEEYLSRHNGEMITQKLNEVYGKMGEDDYKEFERDLEVGLESLRELTKDDAW